MSDDMTTFHIGDADLFLLGALAVLSARHQMKRKGGTMPFLPSDAAAVEVLQSGMQAALRYALDDVPEVLVSVDAPGGVIADIRELAHAAGFGSESPDRDGLFDGLSDEEEDEESG